MSLEQLVYVGEIAAAVAVVISLLYLGAQVHQSNVLSRAQTSQHMIQMARQENFAVAEPPESRTAFTKEEISFQKKLKLNQWLMSALRQREYEWLPSKDGVIDSSMFDADAKVIR